jgi:phosphomannomutase
MKAATPYLEALRYMENAKETLKKAGKDDYDYEDIKYVKVAAGTAYAAVLLALDEYLKRKEGNKYKKPKSIEDYTKRIAEQNKKLLSNLRVAYDTLHLAGYYHGTKSTKIIKTGFEEAFAIIEYIKD